MSLVTSPNGSTSMQTTTDPGAILGGVGAGLLQQPTNTNGSYSGTQSTSGAGSTQRTLSPQQSAIQGPLFQYIQQLMTNPQATLAPFQTAARNNVNANYSGLADTLRQKFLSTGGGSSGKYGLAMGSGEVSRLNDLSNADTQFQEQAAQLPITAAGLAQTFLNTDFGSTTSQGQTSSASGTQSQQQSSGNPLLTGLGTFARILGLMN